MRRKSIKRTLCTLLCALLLVQPLAPSAYAAWWDFPQEGLLAAESPAGVTLNSGTAVIPQGSDLETVKLALAQALVADLSGVDPQSLEWEYYCEGKNGLLKNDAWGSVGGFTSSKKIFITDTTFTHPALADNADGAYQVRLAGTTAEATLNKLAKEPLKQSGITLVPATVAIPLAGDGSVDYAALEQAVFNGVYAGGTPAMSFSDVAVTYYVETSSGLLNYSGYVPLTGGRLYNSNADKIGISVGAISAGSHTIKVSYLGTDAYTACEATASVVLEEKSIETGSILLNDGPYTVPMVYTDAGAIDYAATEEAILSAVVAGTVPEMVPVTVEYNAKNVSLGGGEIWKPLSHTPGALDNTKAFGTGSQAIRLSFAATDRYTAAEQVAAVELTARPQAPIQFVEGTVSLPYNEDLSVNYSALEGAIRGMFTAGGIDLSSAALEYYAAAESGSVGSLGKNWAPLTGGKVSGLDYPAMGVGENQRVRLVWGGNTQYAPTTVEGSVTVSGRSPAAITFTPAEVKLGYVLNEDGSISADTAALEGAIRGMFASDGIDLANARLEYYATAKTGSVGDLGRDWAPLTGGKVSGLDYPAMSEGTHLIRLTWGGNMQYAPTTVEGSVTVIGREQVQFTLREAPYKADMVFNAEQGYDYDATARAIYAAVVESTCPEIGFDAVKVEFTTTSDILGANFKPLDHQGSTGLFDFRDGTWRVRISCGDTVDFRGSSVTVEVTTEDNRIASTVVLKEGASFTYSMDPNVMKQAIFDGVIDWENSVLPAGADISAFEILYKAQMDVLDGSVDADKLGSLVGKIPGLENVGGSIGDIAGSLGEGTKRFMPIEGGKYLGVAYAPMGAGEQQVQVTFKGSAEYKPSDAAAASVTVNKANVKVKVKSTNIYADEPLPDGFITTDPADKFEFYTLYAGANSNVKLGIYLDLPDKFDNSTLIKIIDPVVEKITGKSFSKTLQDGITLGELRQLFHNTELLDLLEKLGVDTGAYGEILRSISLLPSITDGIRIGFGVPNRAGLYTVTAISDNKNYNTGVGVGALLIRMRLSGVKLTWNESLGSKISASDAKNFDFGATLSYNGDVTIDQSSVHYLYSGFTSKWRAYSSTTTPPTEPGRYVVTVVTLGGNYQAAPITRSFQITK